MRITLRLSVRRIPISRLDVACNRCGENTLKQLHQGPPTQPSLTVALLTPINPFDTANSMSKICPKGVFSATLIQILVSK
ncbi:MAG: hypothetical protein QOJ58_5976 [Alphaproteobacteria bacterium]|nr:hypothetical protein [Alphaproteobacteria bacterium]